MSECVFCARIRNGEYSWEGFNSVAFEPLNPVVPGHLLVVPRKHVPNFAWDTEESAGAMKAAAWIASEWDDCNLITSKGAAATQTIMHLHIHLVPRRLGDGLTLPWTGQHERKDV